MVAAHVVEIDVEAVRRTLLQLRAQVGAVVVEGVVESEVVGEILCPKTIPSLTIKWHFSQFKTRLVCSHLCKTRSRLLKQSSKEVP
jgi:hypothetical protein